MIQLDQNTAGVDACDSLLQNESLVDCLRRYKVKLTRIEIPQMYYDRDSFVDVMIPHGAQKALDGMPELVRSVGYTDHFLAPEGFTASAELVNYSTYHATNIVKCQNDCRLLADM